jgi:hypothetical protein
MNRMLIAVAGHAAFLSGAPGAWAFTTQPVSPETMSNRLADPDELAEKNGQSGGTTFGVSGGHMMLEFSAPQSSSPPNSPFVTNPNSALCRANIGRAGPGSPVADESSRGRVHLRANRFRASGKSAPASFAPAEATIKGPG